MNNPARYIEATSAGLFGYTWMAVPIRQPGAPDLAERLVSLIPPKGPAISVTYREDIQNAGVCIRSTEQALAYCRFVHEPHIRNFRFANNDRFIELRREFEYDLANFALEAEHFEIDFDPVCSLVTTDEGLSFFRVRRFVLPHTFASLAKPREGQKDMLSELTQIEEKLTISGQYSYLTRQVPLSTPITLHTKSVMFLLGRPLLVDGRPRVAPLKTDGSWE